MFTFEAKHKIAFEYDLSEELYSIRKVETFLFELNHTLKENTNFAAYKSIVICVLYIKHFHPLVYETFDIGRSPLETIKFTIDKDEYTIFDIDHRLNQKSLLVATFNDLIATDGSNKMSYLFLKLFDYDISHYGKPVIKEEIDINEEESGHIIIRDNNEHKDHIIWNLIASGKSSYSDYQIYAQHFMSDVLSLDINLQIEAYGKLITRMSSEDILQDNTTIYRVAVDSFIEIFKTFMVSETTDDDYLKLINFYFMKSDYKTYDLVIFQILDYFEFDSKRAYIQMLTHLTNLEVNNNFNQYNVYMRFLRKCVSALSGCGYMDTVEYYSINHQGHDETLRTEQQHIINDINKLIADIRKRVDVLSNNRVSFADIVSDFNIVIEFFEKMIQVISHSVPYQYSEPTTRVQHISSQSANRDEMVRLRDLMSHSDDFENELRQSLDKNAITKNNLVELLKEFDITRNGKNKETE